MVFNFWILFPNITLKFLQVFVLALILFSINLLLSLTVLFFFIIRKLMIYEDSILIVLSHGLLPPSLNLFSEGLEEHS